MTITEQLQASLAGRYTVERRIGAGGMATVYLARDVRHERHVAVKVLNPDLGALLGAERFLAEIRVTANLQHPHLLPLFDSGEVDGLLFYVMPYVRGESLRVMLDREKQLPVAEALRIARAVAGALDHAHRHGVIHRDLKPENILLQEGQPLVADFGIALAISNAGGNRITQTGVSLGTPQYMSPEQATGDRTVDARADVYSLSAVLYEMLSGEPPHTGSTSQAVLARVLTERPRSLRTIRPAIPLHVERAVSQGLEKLPADRFASATDLASALSPSSESALPYAGGGEGAGTIMRSRWHFLVPLALGLAAVGGYAIGAGRGRARSPFAAEWTGEKLNGPVVAVAPRVSPDGKFVAFETLEHDQMQIGVLNTESGEYSIRTHALRGYAADIAWSADGRIYFSRHQGGLRTVSSVLPIQGDERPALDSAADAQPLSDNSLLFSRLNAAGVMQLHRSRREQGPVPLGAIEASVNTLGFPVRVFHDGRRAAFYGRPLGDSSAVDHLYVLDLESGAVRPLAPGVSMPNPNFRFSLAVSPDDRWVLFDLPDGDLHRIVAVSSDGGNDVHVLLHLTVPPQGLDMDANGAIYVDQPIQPVEILRAWPGGGRLERTPMQDLTDVLPLSDGRYLVALRYSSRSRIMIASGDKPNEPFVVGTTEPTSFPATLVGADRVALRIGTGTAMRVALVSLATGSLISRLAAVPAAQIRSLAASPDGRSLYYTVKGDVWVADIDGAPPRRIGRGNEVAASPDGKRLLVQRNAPRGNSLVWLTLDATHTEEPIVVRDTLLQIVSGNGNLSPNAVGKDGRIAIRVISRHSWFAPVAVLDPRTGLFEVLKPGFTADAGRPGWAPDGSVVSWGGGIKSSVWKFTPAQH